MRAAGVRVDLEAALDAADHGDAAVAVDLARLAYDRTSHRVHRRRAGVVAPPGRPQRRGRAVRRRGRAARHGLGVGAGARRRGVRRGRPHRRRHRPADRGVRAVAVALVPPAPRGRPRGGVAGRARPRLVEVVMRPMRRLLAGALLAGLAFVPAGRAEAHPLGNLTVNAALDVVVHPDRLDVTYVLDLAELPTVQARQQIDAAGGEAAWASARCDRAGHRRARRRGPGHRRRPRGAHVPARAGRARHAAAGVPARAARPAPPRWRTPTTSTASAGARSWCAATGCGSSPPTPQP